jgi:hypothetical protein
MNDITRESDSLDYPTPKLETITINETKWIKLDLDDKWFSLIDNDGDETSAILFSLDELPALREAINALIRLGKRPISSAEYVADAEKWTTDDIQI